MWIFFPSRYFWGVGFKFTCITFHLVVVWERAITITICSVNCWCCSTLLTCIYMADFKTYSMGYEEYPFSYRNGFGIPWSFKSYSFRVNKLLILVLHTHHDFIYSCNTCILSCLESPSPIIRSPPTFLITICYFHLKTFFAQPHNNKSWLRKWVSCTTLHLYQLEPL